MPKSRVWLATVGTIVMFSGCSMQRHTVYQTPPCVACGTVVFVADGAGDFRGPSVALRKVAEDTGTPLQVETVEWSHGLGRVLSDHLDKGHARAEGRRLAERIVAYKAACPTASIALLSHSAGSAVVLAAAEHLPVGMVDEIVLLAPSVSRDYDLRPALRSSSHGIDAFVSEEDWLVLGLGTALFGTADRRWAPASGRVGFRPVADGPEDAALLAKLRVHPWHPVVAWTGNDGGHDSSYEKEYLKAYVLPTLISPRRLAGG